MQEIDAASNNGVDNIRELREAIRYPPVRGKKKVYIIDEVHMLSSGAWNALLKTLEEPPPHAMFVFATTDPHKVPATILSRVQRYDFKLVPPRRIVEHLAKILDDEKIAHDPAALSLVARESGGSVRDALSLLDQVIAVVAGGADRDGDAPRCSASPIARCSTSSGRRCSAKDAHAALALVDAAFVRGQDLAQLAHAFLGHLRDLVVARVGRRSERARRRVGRRARGAGQGGASRRRRACPSCCSSASPRSPRRSRSRRCRATCSRSGWSS